jgi:hypothetical protein
MGLSPAVWLLQCGELLAHGGRQFRRRAEVQRVLAMLFAVLQVVVRPYAPAAARAP